MVKLVPGWHRPARVKQVRPQAGQHRQHGGGRIGATRRWRWRRVRYAVLPATARILPGR